MHRRFPALALLASVAAACSSAPPPPPMPAPGGPSWPVLPARVVVAPTFTLDPKLAPPLPRTRLVAHAEGFRTPESVLHDPEQDVYFVSNVNGPNDARDNNGFLSRMRPDGSVENRSWVAGGAGGVTRHAPKGMALAGDTLWVTDIDVVRGFHRRTGAVLATVDLRGQGALFLNDLVVGPDGAVYASDTGIRHDALGVPRPGASRIFRLAGGAATVASQDTLLAHPNGLALDRRNGRLIVVSYDHGRVMELKNGALRLLGTGPGQMDGVVVLDDGTILVASQATSAVHRFDDDGEGGAQALTNLMGVGDISVDARRGRLLVALLNQNKVEIHELPR